MMVSTIFITLMSFMACQLSMQLDYEDELLSPDPMKEGMFDGTNAERFVNDNNITYLLVATRIPWEEAEVLCVTQNGTLAILNGDKRKLEFIGRSLAASELLPVEDVWIGGIYNQTSDAWTWIDKLRSRLETKFPPGEKYPREKVPPWLEDPAGSHVPGKCLATFRYNHDTAVFVPMPCRLKRPFLCEIHEGKPEEDDDNDDSPVIIYHIFNQPMSWDAAYIACENREWHLAVLDSSFPLHRLSWLMVRRRPVIDNAWIGGRFITARNKWMWINEEPITVTRNDTAWYPPWYNDEITKTGCLTFDRHVNREPVYVAAACQRPKPFICQEAPKFKPMETFQFEDHFFTFYSQRVNWLEASTVCKSLDARLAVINTKARAEFLSQALTRLTQAGYEKIWIGGKFMKDKWIWASTNDTIYKNEAKETDYPPWQRQPTTRGKNCLGFDRKAFNKPMFIELRCNLKKAFVCEKRSQIRKKYISRGPKEEMEIDVLPGTNMVLSKLTMNWEDAEKSCSKRKSNLLTFSNINNTKEFNKIISELKEIMITAQLFDSPAAVVNVWLGARLSKGVWKWVNTPAATGGFTTTASFQYGPGSKDRIRFLQTDDSEDMDCLNLTRENHADLVLYGIMCNVTQHFVCVG